MPNLALDLGKLVTSTGVKAVYGDQQDLDGIRVVPVAATWSGFGAGQAESEGSGGGGGSVAVPVGVYVRRGDEIRFSPNLVTLLVAAVPFVWITGRTLSRVIRALKR